jgi:hypothetical protein
VAWLLRMVGFSLDVYLWYVCVCVVFYAEFVYVVFVEE